MCIIQFITNLQLEGKCELLQGLINKKGKESYAPPQPADVPIHTLLKSMDEMNAYNIRQFTEKKTSEYRSKIQLIV